MKKIVFATILLAPTFTQHGPINNVYIVWNVGQGAWSTLVTLNACYHFDMGGESFNTERALSHCRHKENMVMLTHLDRDHINHISRFARKTFSFCLHYPKAHGKNWISRLPQCKGLPKNIVEIDFGKQGNNGNVGSIVYLVNSRILISGDAPKSRETRWFRRVPRGLQIINLGHHGSASSTSEELLSWSRPQYAVASARKSRYGHPHDSVIRKLQKKGVSLLTSEIHGDIYFQLKLDSYTARIPSQGPKLQLRNKPIRYKR